LANRASATRRNDPEFCNFDILADRKSFANPHIRTAFHQEQRFFGRFLQESPGFPAQPRPADVSQAILT
jgi:hypothetical protein